MQYALPYACTWRHAAQRTCGSVLVPQTVQKRAPTSFGRLHFGQLMVAIGTLEKSLYA
jgi:hypothetical protein